MIVIIDYKAGNIGSVKNALYRLNCECMISDNPNTILQADKVIFPGVGEASSAMQYLRAKNLDQLLFQITQPMLGICLGLQLMCAFSEEGNTDCLGIFPKVMVKQFPPKDKVPHMGWNNFTTIKGELFQNIQPMDDVYYVHGYYAELNDYTSGVCDYIEPFSAAMQKDNFYATQFHPEKSANIGEQILKNFLAL